MASLSELITEIGDDNVTVQPLHQCMISSNYSNGVTTILFGTNVLGPLDMVGDKKTALIVWMDVDDFNSALKKLKEQPKKH
ncbi:hypothetical protein CRN61_17700 [Vibrio vulnificus]|uniref:hypothetical protein n=1 Tax=Vibrio vulnificus TaxID=672 RepID=UPI000C9DCD7F|nr:hypothetical protein [Vibrio vulnificus]PNG65023.1 hypothetical protein SC81_07860 [Vibrio vulnificus]POC08157.1 hypothetical protein CRN54_16700 [Vibrio vulnificus]POC78026.1 hypothetical protein CRN61_17700 [Vibrio vulnificus]